MCAGAGIQCVRGRWDRSGPLCRASGKRPGDHAGGMKGSAMQKKKGTAQKLGCLSAVPSLIEQESTCLTV